MRRGLRKGLRSLILHCKEEGAGGLWSCEVGGVRACACVYVCVHIYQVPNIVVL